MVQAAAQAQAVVAAAKSRGDGLVPMNSTQIAALSQIQAQAIVNARKSSLSASQKQTQIQLQSQALVHAHTTAQIQAGIYKGDATAKETSTSPPVTTTLAAKSISASAPALQVAAVAAPPMSSSTLTTTTAMLEDRMMNSTATTTTPAAVVDHSNSFLSAHQISNPQSMSMDLSGGGSTDLIPIPSSNSPHFLAQLNGSLTAFWRSSLNDITKLSNQTEHDFKNHNDLPLARIKRIMKSDEDVRMISAEAPVLFAKACELFILDLSIRAWNYSQLHKRRTLQKEDVKEAIQKTDIFDFLVDVIH
jgi:nuclear transcription factor Y gamma